MLSYRFPDYLAYGHTGREGRKRILEDYLHLGAHGAQIFFGQSVNILAVELHGAGSNAVIQAENRSSGGSFSAAGAENGLTGTVGVC